MSEEKRKCWDCKGRGFKEILWYTRVSESWTCETCKGSGYLPIDEKSYMEESKKETKEVSIRLLEDIKNVLGEFVDDEECDYDHGGACQSHLFFGQGECKNARGARLLNVLEDMFSGNLKRDLDDVVDLRGDKLLSALTEAQNKGHYKGWSFSEISRGNSVLPMAVYDETSEDKEITRHISVSSYGSNGNGRLSVISIIETRKGEPVSIKDFYSEDISGAESKPKDIPQVYAREKWIIRDLMNYVSLTKFGILVSGTVIDHPAAPQKEADELMEKIKNDAAKLFAERATDK